MDSEAVASSSQRRRRGAGRGGRGAQPRPAPSPAGKSRVCMNECVPGMLHSLCGSVDLFDSVDFFTGCESGCIHTKTANHYCILLCTLLATLDLKSATVVPLGPACTSNPCLWTPERNPRTVRGNKKYLAAGGECLHTYRKPPSFMALSVRTGMVVFHPLH